MDALQDGLCCEAPDALLKDWFRDNFFQQDLTSEDHTAAFLVLDEEQHAPDTAPLLEALRQPLDVPLQFLDDQQDEQTQGFSVKAYSSASFSRHQQTDSSGGAHQQRDTSDKPRAKNIKRYKSQAQKDAHKRYRERKRQNVSPQLDQPVILCRCCAGTLHLFSTSWKTNMSEYDSCLCSLPIMC